MRIREDTNWQGKIRVIATFADGTQQIDEFENMITNDGLNLLRDSLRGQGDQQIKYVALGAANTAVAATDSLLGGERERFAVTSQTAGGNGVLTTVCFVQAYEATTFTTEEIGWFAGAATSALDSGTLVARVLYSRAKTGLESLQIERTDTIS